eukprot:5254168-Pyramimonas_sp.AAC.1
MPDLDARGEEPQGLARYTPLAGGSSRRAPPGRRLQQRRQEGDATKGRRPWLGCRRRGNSGGASEATGNAGEEQHHVAEVSRQAAASERWCPSEPMPRCVDRPWHGMPGCRPSPRERQGRGVAERRRCGRRRCRPAAGATGWPSPRRWTQECPALLA